MSRGGPLAAALPGLADAWWARHRGRAPRRLTFLLGFVTWRCNLSCAMCGVHHHGTDPGSELDADGWGRVLGQAAELGVRIVSLSGGEPLVRPDLERIVAHATGHGVTVHLCTNAQLLDHARLASLLEAGVSSLSISLDSDLPTVHDRLRGAGSHAATVAAIRLVRERAPHVALGVNATMCASTYERMPELLAFCEELGVGQLKIAPIHQNLLHRHEPLTQRDDLYFRAEQLPALAAELERLRVAGRRSPLRQVSEAFLDGVVDLYHQPRPFRCYAGWAVAAVDPRGQLMPCCDFDEGVDLRQHSLAEAWHSPAFEVLRDRVASCDRPCWDTTNTEIALRLSLRQLPANLRSSLRDLQFYFHRGQR